jgi:hypothetical protein
MSDYTESVRLTNEEVFAAHKSLCYRYEFYSDWYRVKVRAAIEAIQALFEDEVVRELDAEFERAREECKQLSEGLKTGKHK